MPTTTATTSENVAYQLHKAERLLARMTHLLDAADHPAVYIRACYEPSIQIVWGGYDQWVRACDWLSDIGADMTTRDVAAGTAARGLVLMIADATVDGIDVTFSGSKAKG